MNGRANEQRVCAISGAGKGVGAGIARVMAKNGIRVLMGYNSSEELAKKTLKGILDAGGEAFLYKANVTERAQLRGMVNAAIERYGRLDILVNNAAMQPNLTIAEYDFEALKNLWEINIGGYWRLTQEALPYLKRSPAPRVINISSIHAKRPSVFDAGYAMTKGAIRMFTRELALELMKYDIPVNCIELGACKIEYKTGNAPFRLETPLSTRPETQFHHCVVMPEQVGELALFLCGEGGKSLNGDGIRQDMGYMLI